MVTHVRHVDIFHIIYRQYKRIGKQCANLKGKRTVLFASGCRVLELMDEEQIKRLLASGLSEDSITEEMLGFAMTWELFAARADGNYSPRSYEDIMEKIVATGVASRLYVECHRHTDESGRVEFDIVRDVDGRPITSRTFDEAWEKRSSRGEVVNFFFFHAKAVNDLTKTIYGLATPPPDGNGPGKGKGSKAKKGDAQRGPQSGDGHAEQPPTTEEHKTTTDKRVKLRPESASISPEATIPQGSQICEGMSTDRSQFDDSFANLARVGSQNCTGTPRNSAGEGSQNYSLKARKTASNKNLIQENLESCLETIISAPGAIRLTLSHFDFSQPITPDAITHLSRILYAPLPEKYRTPEDKDAAYARIDATAQLLSERKQAHELGLRRLAALMAFQADESSPCTWRPGCRQKYHNPGFVPRLWHLQSELVMRLCAQEMEALGWWPDYLPQATGLVEVPPEIDLLELAGIDEYERVGMDAQTCQAVEEWLTDLLVPHGYEVGHRRVGATRERGYAISLRYTHEDGTRRILRFYRADDWELIMEADGVAPIGSLEFIRHLSEAVRSAQVA